MRKVRGAACVVLGLGVLIGCSTFRDQSKAMVGGGAVAGRDYINGLKPSEKARAYFAQNASDGSKAVTISRTGDGANDTGVRFVANGGVVIPPGTSITFENQGYCCDPHLPAPKAGDEYQFVKTSQLIPEQLQPIYRKLLTKASNGDEATLRSMQKLVWALRTAGTEAGYANNLTDNEKRILNSCSEYEGEFELYCSEKLALSRFWKKLLAKADSYTTINVGGVTYQASDLLDDKVCEKKIKAHLGQLITLGESMPVEHNGFNYGELENGIYTDIKGTGSLKFKATVANSTSQPFTFYSMDYIAQVGSGVSDESESVVYYAAASTTQKQRVTIPGLKNVIVKTGGSVNDDIQHQDEATREQRENIARYLNERLLAFPNAESLPMITPEMIKIDPSSFKGNEEMKYDADNNQFIVKNDISNFSISDYLGHFFLSLGGYSDIDRTGNAASHELAHFYQDIMSERNNSFQPMRFDRTTDDGQKRLVNAEGFAVIMAMRTSDGRGVLTEHRNVKINGTNVTYVEASARFCERMATQESSSGNKSYWNNLAREIRSVESGGGNDASYRVYEKLRSVPVEKFADGIRE